MKIKYSVFVPLFLVIRHSPLTTTLTFFISSVNFLINPLPQLCVVTKLTFTNIPLGGGKNLKFFVRKPGAIKTETKEGTQKA